MKKIIRDKSTPENKAMWEKVEEECRNHNIEVKAIQVLANCNIKITAKDFLDVLTDEKRLAEVLSKLKLKAFW